MSLAWGTIFIGLLLLGLLRYQDNRTNTRARGKTFKPSNVSSGDILREYE